MGMDVSGRAPRSETGGYFRQNVWGWHPLWDYCSTVAPDLCNRVAYAHSNDGDGLDDADANALGLLLQAHIDTGQAAEYVVNYDKAMAAIPDEPCRYCEATGIRTDTDKYPGVKGLPKKQKKMPDGTTRKGVRCNGCHGKGKVRPIETHYGIDVETIQDFANFLKDCGGFQIW